MALRNPLRTFDHKAFFSMINRDDGEEIPDYYATNIENWLIRDNAQLEMRDGLTARGTSPSATNLGAFVAYRADGSVYQYRVVDGAANTAKFQYSTNGSTWIDIASGGSRTTGKRWVFAQANNFVYGVNGYDTPVKLDADVITTMGSMPNGTALIWWRNFLWIIGNLTVPDRLYYSNVNDPDTFGGSSFINVNLGDTSPGVGLRGTGGSTPRLFVGKARSIWFLTGSSSSDFAIQPLTYEHGVASHESMVERRNDVWCLDLEGNVRALYRSQNDDPATTLKSSDIQQTIAGLNKISMEKATAIFFNNFTMFFVPNGVDDYNSLVMVWDQLANKNRGGWVLFKGWNIARAVVFDTNQPKLWLHDARTGNGQSYEWTGTSDNGVAITAKYDTKIYHHGVPELQKRWSYAYQFAPGIGEVPVNFYASIDRFYYTLLKTFNLTATNSLWGTMVWGTDRWGSGGFVKKRIYFSDNGGTQKGFTNQVRLEATSSTTKIKLRRFTMHFRVFGLQ